MTRHRTTRLLLACAIAASFEPAHAGPEECLTLRDNTAVAGCAHKYAPGSSANVAPTVRPAVKPTPPQPIQVAEQFQLFPVPTPGPRAVAQVRESPQVVAERDRSELIRRSEMGAVGLAAMGLVFGVWRWRSTMVKSCSYCGSRLSPGAAVCKRCFRSV
jgi:hypothetical protein